MTLLHQRTGKDIWQHLYEFPLQELSAPDSRLLAPDSRLSTFTHILSHQRLHVTFTQKEVEKLPQIDGCFPTRWNELQNYALSRLTLKFLDQIS
jgi:adenine-specific DNA glycosylase